MKEEDPPGILAREKVPYRRVRALGALLARETGLGSEGLTLVGGSALEVYTAGEYVSEDIDLVASEPSKVEAALRGWGFRRRGMYWVHEELRLFVQIVGRHDSGDPAKSQLVSTPYGSVRLGAMEDLVWRRVYEARGWNRPTALDEAALLVQRFMDRLDWDYLERRGRENGVADLIAELRRTRGTLRRRSRP